MSTNNSNEWVREGTPREDWDSDTDYGVEVDPAEWDDYAEEQAVPVRTPEAARDYVPPTPQAEPEPAQREAVTDPVDEKPADTTQQAEAVPEPEVSQEPRQEAPEQPAADAPDDARAEAAPEGDAHADEAPLDDARAGVSPVDEFDSKYQTSEDEPTEVRPRPIVPETASVEPRSLTDEADRPRSADPVADEDPEATAVHDVVADDARSPEPSNVESQRFENISEPPAAVPVAAAPEEDPAPEYGQDEVPESSSATEEEQGEYASLYREGDQDVAMTSPETDAETTQAFTPEADDNTRVIDDERLAAEEAEERERQARLQEQRDARDARLGVVSSAQNDGVRVVTKPVKRQADKFFGAFSLFLLRGVLAAILGVLAYQVLQDVTRAEEFIAGTVVPEPRLVAWILGYGLAALAALLLIGLGARFFGVVLVLISGASLAVFRWGSFSIFMDGREGFLGDRTLLTLVAALVIVAFGAGRWSIDGAISAARRASKEESND